MSMELAIEKDMTTRQKAFVGLAGSGIDLQEAAKQAGYSESDIPTAVARLLRDPAIIAAVQIDVAKRLAIGSGIALRVLQEFAVDDTLDKRLRVVCAKTLLDRAGHIAPKAVAAAQGGETPLNEMSMTDLRALADKLSGEIAGRAKVVNSAKAAPVKTQAFDDLI